MKFKLITMILMSSLLTSGCTLLKIIAPPPYTNQQCEKVEQNFDKLKVGMTQEEVIPLIGGERKLYMIFSPGKFLIPGKIPLEYDPQQKTPWKVWVLCNNPEKRLEWLMVAFDTKTNKVVKIFSDTPDSYGFD